MAANNTGVEERQNSTQEPFVAAELKENDLVVNAIQLEQNPSDTYSSCGKSPRTSIQSEDNKTSTHSTSSSVDLWDSSQSEETDAHLREVEAHVDRLIEKIQPNARSLERRYSVFNYVQRLFLKSMGTRECAVYMFGSVPLRTYLPDGDIDLTAVYNGPPPASWADKLRNTLEAEEQNPHAQYTVRDVQTIHAEVKLMKCLVGDIVVDISADRLGGLSTLCFLEEVDRFIGKENLFKRSIILIKAWCYYESRVLGAHHGLISTYALETLVLYIFNTHHKTLRSPLQALSVFLDVFSKFDWEKHGLSLQGPIPLSRIKTPQVDEPEVEGAFLLSEQFLANMAQQYTPNGNVEAGPEGVKRGLNVVKHLNVVDPLLPSNNLGRSVSQSNLIRIRRAFTHGAAKLQKALHMESASAVAEIDKFFAHVRRSRRDCVVALDESRGPSIALASPLLPPSALPAGLLYANLLPHPASLHFPLPTQNPSQIPFHPPLPPMPPPAHLFPQPPIPTPGPNPSLPVGAMGASSTTTTTAEEAVAAATAAASIFGVPPPMPPPNPPPSSSIPSNAPNSAPVASSCTAAVAHPAPPPTPPAPPAGSESKSAHPLVSPVDPSLSLSAEAAPAPPTPPTSAAPTSVSLPVSHSVPPPIHPPLPPQPRPTNMADQQSVPSRSGPSSHATPPLQTTVQSSQQPPVPVQTPSVGTPSPPPPYSHPIFFNPPSLVDIYQSYGIPPHLQRIPLAPPLLFDNHTQTAILQSTSSQTELNTLPDASSEHPAAVDDEGKLGKSEGSAPTLSPLQSATKSTLPPEALPTLQGSPTCGDAVGSLQTAARNPLGRLSFPGRFPAERNSKSAPSSPPANGGSAPVDMLVYMPVPAQAVTSASGTGMMNTSQEVSENCSEAIGLQDQLVDFPQVSVSPTKTGHEKGKFVSKAAPSESSSHERKDSVDENADVSRSLSGPHPVESMAVPTSKGPPVSRHIPDPRQRRYSLGVETANYETANADANANLWLRPDRVPPPMFFPGVIPLPIPSQADLNLTNQILAQMAQMQSPSTSPFPSSNDLQSGVFNPPLPLNPPPPCMPPASTPPLPTRPPPGLNVLPPGLAFGQSSNSSGDLTSQSGSGVGNAPFVPSMPSHSHPLANGSGPDDALIAANARLKLAQQMLEQNAQYFERQAQALGVGVVASTSYTNFVTNPTLPSNASQNAILTGDLDLHRNQLQYGRRQRQQNNYNPRMPRGNGPHNMGSHQNPSGHHHHMQNRYHPSQPDRRERSYQGGVRGGQNSYSHQSSNRGSDTLTHGGALKDNGPVASESEDTNLRSHRGYGRNDLVRKVPGGRSSQNWNTGKYIPPQLRTGTGSGPDSDTQGSKVVRSTASTGTSTASVGESSTHTSVSTGTETTIGNEHSDFGSSLEEVALAAAIAAATAASAAAAAAATNTRQVTQELSQLTFPPLSAEVSTEIVANVESEDNDLDGESAEQTTPSTPPKLAAPEKVSMDSEASGDITDQAPIQDLNEELLQSGDEEGDSEEAEKVPSKSDSTFKHKEEDFPPLGGQSDNKSVLSRPNSGTWGKN